MLNVSVAFQEKTSKDPLLKYRWHSIRIIMLVDVEDVGVAVVALVAAAVAVAWIEEVAEEEGTVFVLRVVEVNRSLDSILLTAVVSLEAVCISSPNQCSTMKPQLC